jgi:hypothetical protein
MSTVSTGSFNPSAIDAGQLDAYLSSIGLSLTSGQQKAASSSSLTQPGTSSQHPVGSGSNLLTHEHLSSLNVEQLYQAIRTAKSKSQDNERLKQLVRNNHWPSSHPIRKYLWKCLLQLPTPSTSSTTTAVTVSSSLPNSPPQQRSNNDKENKLMNKSSSALAFSNEIEYNRQLNQIFGKSKPELN